jgi:hypothetical protein
MVIDDEDSVFNHRPPVRGSVGGTNIRTDCTVGVRSPAPTGAAAGDGGGENLHAVLEAMKALVARYGADHVRRMVELLG